jgi:hypothetical protein
MAVGKVVTDRHLLQVHQLGAKELCRKSDDEDVSFSYEIKVLHFDEPFMSTSGLRALLKFRQ